jgi:hypothetical protein
MDVKAFQNLIETTTSCNVASYMKTYSGIATFFRTRHDPGFSATDIALVGLPIDAGLTQRTGAQMLFEILCLSAEAFARRTERAPAFATKS